MLAVENRLMVRADHVDVLDISALTPWPWTEDFLLRLLRQSNTIGRVAGR